jgi:hypothetical protein
MKENDQNIIERIIAAYVLPALFTSDVLFLMCANLAHKYLIFQSLIKSIQIINE